MYAQHECGLADTATVPHLLGCMACGYKRLPTSAAPGILYGMLAWYALFVCAGAAPTACMQCNQSDGSWFHNGWSLADEASTVHIPHTCRCSTMRLSA